MADKAAMPLRKWKESKSPVFFCNSAFLIDYKTGLPEEKHKKQIENYTRVIEKMNLKVTKKVLLYIGEELKIIHL